MKILDEGPKLVGWFLTKLISKSVCAIYRNMVEWEYSSIYIWVCGVSDNYMVFPEILNKHLKLSKFQCKCYKIQLNTL